MTHYVKDQTKYGPSTAVINSKTAHADSLKQIVKTVALAMEEFTLKNVKAALKNKAAGIITIIGNENFVPTSQWDEAYQYLRKFWFFSFRKLTQD